MMVEVAGVTIYRYDGGDGWINYIILSVLQGRVVFLSKIFIATHCIIIITQSYHPLMIKQMPSHHPLMS